MVWCCAPQVGQEKWAGKERAVGAISRSLPAISGSHFFSTVYDKVIHMTDYTEVRLRVAWVVLGLLAVCAATTDETASSQRSNPTEASPLPTAALTIARALLIQPDPPGTTQELRVGDTTLVVRRRSKTPQAFSSLPHPVYITSEPLTVNDEAEAQKSRAGRKLEIDSDGIPVVHGVRVPDDENDKMYTWRNARVIRNMLVPNLPSVRRQARLAVVEEGSTAVRAPVTQYAHPELGAQPALSAPAAQPAVVYFARDNPQDIHNDHSPYPFEPAELLQRHEEKPYQLKLRPKKTPYMYAEISQTKPKYWAKEQRPKNEYYSSFYTGEDARPFWERLSELIRTNVQTGVARMSDLARPVMEPIVSASQAFTANLGLGQRAQDKVGVAPALATATHMLPALGLVAGGAALGLGAAAVGRLLEHTQVVDGRELEHDRVRRAIESTMHEDNFMREETSPASFLAQLQRFGHAGWSDDPMCAKRIFCDVMSQQDADNVILMEKKMASFLSLVQRGVSRALGEQLGEVMTAVRRQDCSVFECAHAGIRRAISGAAVEAPGGGPGPR